MENLKRKKEPFWGYIPKGRKEYNRFIRVVFDHADSVCFTVKPFLDNIDEFNNSIWSAMRYSVLDHGFARAASNPANVKSHLILLKKDYYLYDFLQRKNSIFDFTEEDPDCGIWLDDPAFIKDGEVFCYTVTHEKICIVTEDVYKQLCGWKCKAY